MQSNNVIYSMFNLGTGELVLIFLVILLLFGAKRLPDLAKGLGKGIKEFKGAVESGKKEIIDAKDSVESKKTLINDLIIFDTLNGTFFRNRHLGIRLKYNLVFLNYDFSTSGTFITFSFSNFLRHMA